MNEILARYNPWWESADIFSGLINRPEKVTMLLSHFSSRHIIFLTGLRRVGKTTLFKLIIKHLIQDEMADARHILYVSLDDYQLAHKSLFEIIDAYRQLHKILYQDMIYLFLDEITAHPDYEIQLKNLYDKQNIKIYASSSSASLLKTKKPYLTGRHITVEILPLDFEEYLDFKQIHLSPSNASLSDSYFEDYLKEGGLPEYVIKPDVEYLRTLVDDIIYKDIAAVHHIRNLSLLKDFFTLLMERAGKQVSINKLAHILSISPDTAKRYLHLFADTYLIYLMPRYGKTNTMLLSPQKIYCADLGIRVLFTGFRDKGSLFENYVYLKLKHLHPRYVYENKCELDFFTETQSLIEVKYHGELTSAQKKLFERFPAKRKTVIQSYRDVKALAWVTEAHTWERAGEKMMGS